MKDGPPPGLERVSEREVLTEQVRVVYSMLGQSGLMTLALSAFVAFVLRDLGPPIAIWLGVQAVLKLADQVELRWFYRAEAVADNPEGYVRRLYLTQSCHAAGWASIIWVAARGGASATEFVFIIMTLGGVLSGGVTTYGALPRVHAAYILTCMVIDLAAFADLIRAIPDNPFYYWLPILHLIYCIGTFLNTRVSGSAYFRYITLGFANAELARSLAEEVGRADLARREAEAADAAKSTFLASASHDLRQPIHAAGLFLAILRDSPLDPRQREILANAASALHASSSMLDALLDFSRAEAGVIVPQVRPFPIDDLFTEVEVELGLQADEKRIAFRVRECGAMVESDPALVRLVLLNLVSNAVRYTERGGLLLAGRRRGGRLWIEVWDTGVGVAPDQHEAIFADFIQIGNPERDRRKGLGLGLAIARRVARLIESDVTLRSRPGRGSVFRFALPLATGDAGAGVTRSVRPAGEPAVRLVAGAAAGAGGDGSLPPERRARVLLLDDDPLILRGLGGLLEGAGHAVSAAETIEEALTLAEEHRPDLLVCDFRLRQGRDGAEAVRLLRDRHGRDLPALIITGDTHPDRIAMAEREDLCVLYKPVDPDLILARIGELLG